MVRSVEVVAYLRCLDTVRIKGFEEWSGLVNTKLQRVRGYIVALLVTSEVRVGWTGEFYVAEKKCAICECKTTK
jgi:hypothetical protein